MAFIPPLTPLSYLQPPDQEVSEADKFKDDKKWWCDWGRYIVSTFWNPIRRDFYENAVANTLRFNDRMMENIKYYYGVQGMNSLNYARADATNRQGTAVFIPDQKIRSLVDYMKGNVIDMIQPIKDSISATGLSEHIQSERDLLWSQLRLQYDLQKRGMQEMGVSYSPLPEKQFDSIQAIDDFMAEWQHEYEEAAVAITENIYFEQNLSEQFEDDGMNVLIGSLCSTLVEVENGRVVNTQIPCYNAIYDYRSKNQYGKGAMVAGGVFNATPAELFAKFPELTLQERQVIETGCMSNTQEWIDFRNFYNDGASNITHWNADSGTVSYAICYFIARKDLEYKVFPNAFGGSKVINITDGMPTYATTNKKAKGDIAGTKWAWMVHKCVLIGNYICTDCGYPEYQIRPNGDHTMPQIPIIQLHHASIAGFSRSVVDRLRQHADFRGILMEKVQVLVANDIGKGYFIRGSAIDGMTDPEEILKDLKAMKIHVITGASGEVDNQLDGQKTIEMIDMSLDPNIMNYIRLADNESRLMEEIVSIPSVALGTQTDVIGKAVQQQTIVQATYGQKSFYTSLMEHWRLKFQYNFNTAKLLYTEAPETVKLLPISEKQTYLLKVTKKFRAEDVGIYILPNDPIEAKDMQIFEQAILGYMQNINAPGAADALRNSLKLMGAKTYSQAIEGLDKFIRNQKADQAKAQAMQQKAEMAGMQQQSQLQEQQIITQQYTNLINKLKEIEDTKSWDYKIAIDSIEAKMSKVIDQKFAEGIIKANHAEIEQRNAAPQQQQQPAAEQPQPEETETVQQ